MPCARLRETFSTLRFRLVAWITLIVGAVVVITMVVLGQVVDHLLLYEFDTALREEHIDVRQLLRENMAMPDLIRELDARAQEKGRGWYVQIYDGAGKLLWQSSAAPKLPGVSVGLANTRHFDHDGMRSIEGPAPARGLLVRVGLSRQGLDADMALVDQIIVLASVCILVLTPLAGFFLAGRATRPLQWIISTTSRLQPQHLDERLPVRGSRDELDQLSETINGMLDRIASYIERNRDFVASAAHELRSPLAAIRASVEVALNRPRSAGEYANLLEEVMEECTRLSTLLDRLLLLAEGDAGQAAFGQHTSRLDKIVRESVDMFQGVAEVQGVPLHVGPLPPVSVPGDDQHLRQVVRNLIDNALKFTQPPGTVSIELESGPKTAVLRVRDQGVGIGAEDLPRIRCGNFA